mgnify:CR=1 FL=1
MGTRRAPAGLWVGRRTGDGGTPPPPPPWSLQAGRPFTSTRYTITVGDQTGRPIGELMGRLESVNVRQDGYGQAAMLVASTLVRDRLWLVEFGNRVMIEFENGIEPWGGVIDVPRENSAAMARLQMYQAGYLMGWDALDEDVTYAGTTAGTACSILRDVVSRSSLNIELADWGRDDGETLDVTFSAQETIASAAARLRELDPRMHWGISPRWVGGRIVFELSTWRDNRRDDSSRVVLVVGHNLVGVTSLEQGPIINDVRVEAAGRSGGVRWDNAESVKRFGRRKEMVTLPDTTDAPRPGYAEQFAAGRGQALAWPRVRTTGVALDLAPGRYRDYAVGSRVMIEGELPQATFRPATVVSADYAPGDGMLHLVIDGADQVEP